MKMIALILLFAANSWASECFDDAGNDMISNPEVFTVHIAESESCYDAVRLAEACAWGSSIDVMTAGTAGEVCQRALENESPSKQHLNLLEKMEEMCNDKYAYKEGTMYRSINAFCQLDALEWILGIASDY